MGFLNSSLLLVLTPCLQSQPTQEKKTDQSKNMFLQLFVNAALESLTLVAFDSWFWMLPSRTKLSSVFGPEKTNAKAAADSLLKTRASSGTISVQSNDTGTQAEEATGSPLESPVDNSDWNNVICTIEAANLVEKKLRAKPKMIRLRSIAGIGTGDINRKQLGSWCSHNGITGTRYIAKDLACKKIILYILNMEQIQAGLGEASTAVDQLGILTANGA
jgi:hypothetical protein